ncbi:MAG: nuclear transport factor 2 family protein [Thalassotalea sp.]|nr:nuclear transport factor 2 family protein [Thalassotalea sp.]
MTFKNIVLMGTLLTWVSFTFASDKATAVNPAVKIVDKQLAAYNNQDIDAFIATYHQDVEIYDFPNSLKYTGKENLKQNYQGMFERLKCLQASSKKRIVLYNTVIDHELAEMCTTDKHIVDKSIEVIAIYEVEDGLIKRVMFQR